LYAPPAYVELLKHPGMTSLGSLVQTRIGLQSFAKMFYIISRETQQRWELERRWLRPMIMSPKDVETPRLARTHLLRYIQYWETQVLNPRGLARPVVGVQNLPRLRKTRRTPWYNLLTDLTRRGTASILLPRRIYQRYQVVWNQAGWVAGENFIEMMPLATVPLLPFLAILNAGTTEIAVRVKAHVYGGGVYNLNPGSIDDVPVIDVRALAPAVLQRLEEAYKQFLLCKGKNRPALDAIVLEGAGLPAAFLPTLQAALRGLQHFSDAILEPMQGAAADGTPWPEELRLL
jgi:hypothetical protein